MLKTRPILIDYPVHFPRHTIDHAAVHAGFGGVANKIQKFVGCQLGQARRLVVHGIVPHLDARRNGTANVFPCIVHHFVGNAGTGIDDQGIAPWVLVIGRSGEGQPIHPQSARRGVAVLERHLGGTAKHMHFAKKGHHIPFLAVQFTYG